MRYSPATRARPPPSHSADAARSALAQMSRRFDLTLTAPGDVIVFGSNAARDKTIPGTLRWVGTLSNFQAACREELPRGFKLVLKKSGIKLRFMSNEEGYQALRCSLASVYSSSTLKQPAPERLGGFFLPDADPIVPLLDIFGDGSKRLGFGRRAGKLPTKAMRVNNGAGIAKRRRNGQHRALAAKYFSNPLRLEHLGLRQIGPSKEEEDAEAVFVPLMAGVQAAHASQSAAYRERLLSTGDRELVEMPNRGQGGPWTGGPGGLNWNGKANMRVRDALRAQDWQQELARLVAECDAIRASFV